MKLLLSVLAIGTLGTVAFSQPGSDALTPSGAASAQEAKKHSPRSTPVPGAGLAAGQGGITGLSSRTALDSSGPGLKLGHMGGTPGTTLTSGQGGFSIHFGGADAAPSTISTGQGGVSATTAKSK